ncbi:MAG: hypothetical protein AAFY82_03575, partial [Pseudomonadota bacterium]
FGKKPIDPSVPVKATQPETPHYGGQIGLVALLCMLSVTGCVAFTGTDGSIGFLPNWAQKRIDGPVLIPATNTQAVSISAPAATFIVKFENEPALETVYRNFRRDEEATRAAYQAWAAGHAQLKGLALVRASYSGELVLALPQNDPLKRSVRDVITQVETIETLDYIEIDSVARASEGNP